MSVPMHLHPDSAFYIHARHCCLSKKTSSLKPCLPAPQGNLSEFVKVRPEARSYYELSAAKLKFNLPKPGFLDGVKSRVRKMVLLSMLPSHTDTKRNLP